MINLTHQLYSVSSKYGHQYFLGSFSLGNPGCFSPLYQIIGSSRREKHLSPGPKPWPIIGNLNLIGPNPHHSFHKLSQKYGQIMQLKFGSCPVVVASSPEMAKQFLKTYDQIFASRPALASGKYTSYNYRGILFAPYGPQWRKGRKIYLTHLLNSKCLESLDYICVEETQALISRLYALSGKNVVLRDHLSRTSLSITSRMILGKKYFSVEEGDNEIVTLDELLEMVHEFFVLNGVLNIGDWIPWIDFLDLQGCVKRIKAFGKKFHRFPDRVLDDHRARRVLEKDNFEAKDLVDHLLLQLANDDSSVDEVKGIIQDLIIGGTEALSSVIEWAMSELMKQPHIIKKATEELDRVIGRDRWVEARDFLRLPYLDAIVKENARLHPVAPLLPPHLALEDCKVAGYDIRKGTAVFINVWSIGRDPTSWDAVEKFRPERFLGKDIDVMGQNFELLPFGSGRRMCPGYNLGIKMIRLILANLLHGFNWKLPDNMTIEELSMDEVYALTETRKYPLVAVMEPRIPLGLY